MRKQLSKQLRREFDAAVRRLHPRFSRNHSGGDVVRYGLTVSPVLVLFLGLQTKPTDDSFTVEVGWGPEGEWPYDFADPASFADKPGNVRLGELLPVRNDKWWYLDPVGRRPFERIFDPPSPLSECLPTVSAVVREVFELMLAEAVPLWDKLVRAKGGSPILWA